MSSLSLRCRASAWRRAASFRSSRCCTFPSGVAHAFAAIASATIARCRARSSACFARSSAASSSRIPGEHDRARSGLPPKARSGDDAELRGGAGEPRSGELRGGCGDERGDGERSPSVAIATAAIAAAASAASPSSAQATRRAATRAARCGATASLRRRRVGGRRGAAPRRRCRQPLRAPLARLAARFLVVVTDRRAAASKRQRR